MASLNAVTLFALHLSTHKDGMSKGSVKAVPAPGAVGHLCKVKETLVQPDREAVRACLPHYYRKAFDRQGGHFWYVKHGEGAPHLTLRDSKGKWLNVLYAIPYVYDPNTTF